MGRPVTLCLYGNLCLVFDGISRPSDSFLDNRDDSVPKMGGGDRGHLLPFMGQRPVHLFGHHAYHAVLLQCLHVRSSPLVPTITR